jgi:hypothetical protein
MHIKRRLLSVSLIVVIVGVVALLLTSVQYPALIDRLFGLKESPHLSDEQLIENFNSHRPKFEQLRQMIIQDKGLLRITSDRTWPDDPQTVGISRSRIAEYRKLLNELGIRGLEISKDQKNIQFVSSYRGFATHGSQKGYEYMSEAVNVYLVADLSQLAKGGVGRRRIEGNWYLFFEGY